MTLRTITSAAPWTDLAAAQLFLSGLVNPLDDAAQAQAAAAAADHEQLATWLVAQGLGPLAAHAHPALQPILAGDVVNASAETHVHLTTLRDILERLNAENIPCVLMKGCALATSAYPKPALRTMSDIDFWIHRDDIERAVDVLKAAGFESEQDGFQLTQHGKITLNRPQWRIGGLDVHTNPFAGHYLNYVGAVDLESVWQRTEPREWQGVTAHYLSAEDMLIQVLMHLVVGNQFSQAALRGLADIAFLTRRNDIDWQIVAQRATEWHLQTPTWLGLSIGDQIYGLPGAAAILPQLQPSRRKRDALTQFVDVEKVMGGHDFRHSRQRFLYLLQLVNPSMSLLQKTVR